MKNTEYTFKNAVRKSWLPMYHYFRSRFLEWKYSGHASEVSFEWDWSKTNYNRIALVNLFLRHLEDPSYLEIGCQNNALFDSIPVAKKTGVDPYQGGTIRTTSDDFFQQNSDFFDFVFIDGLHTFEQVRKDIINALAKTKVGGWVAIHDMLPRSWVEEHVPVVSQGAWTGDVWKVAFELVDAVGIDFRIVKIDHGVGLVRLISHEAKLAQKDFLNNENFSYFAKNHRALPVISWEEMRAWLDASNESGKQALELTGDSSNI
jgi:hypothetical protein